MTFRRKRCPKCQKLSAARIIYGLPTPDIYEVWDRGQIILGGCCIWENMPDWMCRECGYAWNRYGPAPFDPYGTRSMGDDEANMSVNKKTIERYMAGFRQSDHAMVLSCLTDDVTWDIPGFAHLEGKAAFDAEIENPAFVGKPRIEVTRLLEENDVVVAEGNVRSTKADGSDFHAVFCDVFEMRGGRISRVVSYLMELRQT